jgi:hypothetical protein
VCHRVHRLETHLKPENMLITAPSVRPFILNTQFMSSDDCSSHDESATGTMAVITDQLIV